jgi:uncharacterized OsmC-like protein
MADTDFTVTLTLHQDYAFEADLGLPGLIPLRVDESPPLGAGQGPSPVRLLAVAVGHCLGASALFCLRKARVDVRALGVTVDVRLARNERGRLRIGGIRVALAPRVAPADAGRMGRCLEIFEDFCVVTQSVRDGIDVKVEVAPAAVA